MLPFDNYGGDEVTGRLVDGITEVVAITFVRKLGWRFLWAKLIFEVGFVAIAWLFGGRAWYRARRLVSLDGSCLDVADTEENQAAFERPGASLGENAFLQLRFVALVENGTHVLLRHPPWRVRGRSPRARPALHEAVLEEILEEGVASGRGRQVPRGVKRKMSAYKLRPRTPQLPLRVDFTAYQDRKVNSIGASGQMQTIGTSD